MSKGKKTGGRDFKPGNPGGPGHPKTSPEVRAIQKITREELTRVLDRCLDLNLAQIVERAKDPTVPALELMVLKVMESGLKTGDTKKLGFLLDRMGIIVTQKVELKNTGSPQVHVYLPDNGRAVKK